MLIPAGWFTCTDRIDGWVSIIILPLLASDNSGSIEAARMLHEHADWALNPAQRRDLISDSGQ